MGINVIRTFVNLLWDILVLNKRIAHKMLHYFCDHAIFLFTFDSRPLLITVFLSHIQMLPSNFSLFLDRRLCRIIRHRFKDLSTQLFYHTTYLPHSIPKPIWPPASRVDKQTCTATSLTIAFIIILTHQNVLDNEALDLS